MRTSAPQPAPALLQAAPDGPGGIAVGLRCWRVRQATPRPWATSGSVSAPQIEAAIRSNDSAGLVDLVVVSRRSAEAGASARRARHSTDGKPRVLGGARGTFSKHSSVFPQDGVLRCFTAGWRQAASRAPGVVGWRQASSADTTKHGEIATGRGVARRSVLKAAHADTTERKQHTQEREFSGRRRRRCAPLEDLDAVERDDAHRVPSRLASLLKPAVRGGR